MIGTLIHSRSSFRVIKDWCINLPNHFWICLSAEHIRKTNICLVFNTSISGKIHRTFANNCNRSLIFITHFVTKCSSSSTILHFLHIRRWDGTIGLEYLPRSISKVWELARSFVMAVRYLWSFTLNKYDSGPKLDLNRRYVLKSGLSRALRPSCHSLMKRFFYLRLTVHFKFHSITRHTHTVCMCHFMNFWHQCFKTLVVQPFYLRIY